MNMVNYIDVYIITSEHLKPRFASLNQQIAKLKTILISNDYKFNFHQINSPSHQDIEKNINDYKEIVDLNKDVIEDEDFKNLVIPLNTNQISNFLKHKKALELIKKSKNRLNFIIEDDFIIIDEFIQNFNDVLTFINKNEFDILFTSISINEEKENEFKQTTDIFKIIVAKSSYFITNDCSIKLLDFITKIRLTYKLNLSYFIWNNRNSIKSLVFNKNVCFEGSKIGLYPTSTAINNFLYQNSEFVKLNSIIANKEEVSDEDIIEAELIYEKSGKNNCDFQHILGLAYFKNKNYLKAKLMMIEAVSNLKKNNGLINQQNEILNNCINIHKFEQKDIENCLKFDGIYS
jgi:hypothetical protein